MSDADATFCKWRTLLKNQSTRCLLCLGFVVATVLCQTAFGDDGAPSGAASLYAGGDSLSIAGAVLITGGDDRSATRAEYAWLKQHVPGAKVTRQSVIVNRGPLLDRILDKLEVTLPDGSQTVYFFDISRTCGKNQ